MGVKVPKKEILRVLDASVVGLATGNLVWSSETILIIMHSYPKGEEKYLRASFSKDSPDCDARLLPIVGLGKQGEGCFLFLAYALVH